MPKQSFQDSPELKRLFVRELEAWKQRTHASIDHLADLCGVTPAYLALVGRYGRVPSKPVLLLLALNFGLKDPVQILRAAGVGEEWPYAEGISLSTRSESTLPGFLNLSIDMQGFAATIREIVKQEVGARRLGEISKQQALRLGINRSQSYLFSSKSSASALGEGIFPNFVKMLSTALRVTITPMDVEFRSGLEKLSRGELDLLGPLHTTPQRQGMAQYPSPFFQTHLGAVWRTKNPPSLPELQKPTTFKDLSKRAYQVVVLRESSSHHYAQTALGLLESQLILAETPLEALERLTLQGTLRAAHVGLMDEPFCAPAAQESRGALEHLILRDQELYPLESTIATRPDWPELLTAVDGAITFMRRSQVL